jgi:hypothetical protein
MRLTTWMPALDTPSGTKKAMPEDEGCG